MHTQRNMEPHKNIPLPAERLAQNVIALCKITGGYSALERRQFVSGLGKSKDGREDIYAAAVELIRSWAAEPNLQDTDAYVVEACRKICDVMGWMPAEVA